MLLSDDRNAFEQLVRRHQGMVRAQLRRLTKGDVARADDLAQETFLLAWRKLHQFRGEAQVSTWLYRIAYSSFLQDRRKKTPGNTDFAGGEPGPSVAPASAVELRFDIERAMGCLSHGEQVVLLHVVQLGLSHEEASYVLAMPLGTVKSHAQRGKARLREMLADWQAGPEEENWP